MRAKFMTLFTVIGALTVLALAGNTVALATTGKAIIAGKGNTSTKLTTLTRTTPGAALQVKTKSNAATPFLVNGTGKVAHLNADKIDGVDSSKLGTQILTWTYTGTSGGSRTLKLSGMPTGVYLVNYEVFTTSLPPGALLDCYLSSGQGGDVRYSAETSVVSSNQYDAGLTGTGQVTRFPGDAVNLICRQDSGGNWSAGVTQPVRITAIPVRGVNDLGTPVPSARLAPR